MDWTKETKINKMDDFWKTDISFTNVTAVGFLQMFK